MGIHLLFWLHLYTQSILSSMYGLLITLGIFLSFLVAEQVVKEKGLTAQHLWGSAFWIIVMGVLGARLYHVIEYAN